MASKTAQPGSALRSTGGVRAGTNMRPVGKLCKASIRENDSAAELAMDKQCRDKPSQPKQSSTKMTSKMLHALDVLTLDQISQLSDRGLLDMFTDFSSDEMTRNYTYTCYLMPSKCCATFRSFGSEARAQANAVSHLKVHLTDLMSDAADPTRSHKLKFTAEPMTARFRRLSGLAKTPKKKQGLQQTVVESERKSDTKENEPTSSSPVSADVLSPVASRDALPQVIALPRSPKKEPADDFEGMQIDRTKDRQVKGCKRLTVTTDGKPSVNGAARSRVKPALDNSEQNELSAVAVSSFTLPSEKLGGVSSKRGVGTVPKRTPDEASVLKRKRVLPRAGDGGVGTAAKKTHKITRRTPSASAAVVAATAAAASAKGGHALADGSSEVSAGQLLLSSRGRKWEPEADHCYVTSSCERCCKDPKRSRDTFTRASSGVDDDGCGASAARTCVPYTATGAGATRLPVPPSVAMSDRSGQPSIPSDSLLDADESPGEKVMVDYASPNNVMTVKIKTGYLLTCNSVSIPIMQLAPVLPGDSVVSSVGAEVTVELDASSTGNVGSSGSVGTGAAEHVPLATSRLARPYPPMPKYPTQHGLRLIVPEEEVQFLDEDHESTAEQPHRDVDNEMAGDDASAEGDEQQLQQSEESNKQRLNLPAGSRVDTSRYQERMLAIKCIRELKSGEARNTSDHLRCKVCSKTFTASATLMYHYRSHAGIKPFMCLLCNNYFTRQHSLNYHMLIHTGQSRFKCPDCGRAFRHPSHFKEHQRRHTGETPFECTDCSMKFKTRNTFKRHLRTRHCKLLTAKGIHKMEGVDLKASCSPSDSCSSGDPSKDVENEEDARSPNASESSESEACAE